MSVNEIAENDLQEIFAQMEMEELQNKYNFILETSDAHFGLNIQGEIIFWCESASLLFGFSRIEIFGKFIDKIFPEIDWQSFKRISKIIETEGLWEGESKTSSKSQINEILYIKIIRIENDIADLAVICSKFTPKQLIDKQIRASEEHFRNIVSNARDFICTINTDGIITYGNQSFMEKFGIEERDFENIKFDELFYTPEQKVEFDISKILATSIASIELKLKIANNKSITVLGNFSPVKNNAGEIKIINAVLTDITQQKMIEDDAMLMHSVFESSQEGIAVQSEKGFILANESFTKIFGWNESKELNLVNPIELFSNIDKPVASEIINGLFSSNILEKQFEFKGKKNLGEEFYAEAWLKSHKFEKNNFIIWVVRDISDKKFAEKLLKESEERYRDIAENIRDVIWAVEKTDGTFGEIFYNSAIKKITGYEIDAFKTNRNLWNKIIHPDDIARIIKRMKQFYKNQKKDSEVFEYRILHKKGFVVWIRNEISVDRDSAGIAIKIYGIVSDITLQKRSEKELQNYAENLKQLNETKDKFISIISHDLRSPFSSIIGFADLLLANPNAPVQKITEYSNFIRTSSQNLLKMVNSLLDWARLQTGRTSFDPERTNVKEIVMTAISIQSGNALQKNINIESKISEDQYIHADFNLILQVFSNLISNAIKFTHDGGKVTIDSNFKIKERAIEFSVQDNGIGISEENKDKLFRVDSKLTTVGTAGERGSGLGLSFSYEIIKKHGGEFRIESEVNKGSTFYFTIPISSSYILIVDDANADRILYAKLLKNILPKYNIVEAVNGEEALSIISDILPSLVITDHDMPVLNGFNLVKSIKFADLKYQPPIIVLSSYIDDDIAEKYKKIGVDFIFQKPVNLGVFKQAIEKALKKRQLFN